MGSFSGRNRLQEATRFALSIRLFLAGLRDESAPDRITGVFCLTPGGRYLLAHHPPDSCVCSAIGILRAHLFDIDLRIRWTIKQSTLAAIIVAILFVIPEGTERMLSSGLGNIASFVQVSLSAGARSRPITTLQVVSFNMHQIATS